MGVFSRNIVSSIAIIFLFLREVRVVVLLGGGGLVALSFTSAIHKIKLADVSCSEESVCVLRSLNVDTVELSDSSVLVDNLAIA